jgi:hypothetical protein
MRKLTTSASKSTFPLTRKFSFQSSTVFVFLHASTNFFISNNLCGLWPGWMPSDPSRITFFNILLPMMHSATFERSLEGGSSSKITTSKRSLIMLEVRSSRYWKLKSEMDIVVSDVAAETKELICCDTHDLPVLSEVI